MSIAAPDFPIVDLDQHYYEPDDCCTRHIESKYADRAVRIREDEDGRRSWYAGDRPLTFDRRPLDYVLEPGDLRRLLAERSGGGVTEPRATCRIGRGIATVCHVLRIFLNIPLAVRR